MIISTFVGKKVFRTHDKPKHRVADPLPTFGHEDDDCNDKLLRLQFYLRIKFDSAISSLLRQIMYLLCYFTHI